MDIAAPRGDFVLEGSGAVNNRHLGNPARQT
jgi:hypothetical protein